MSERLCTDRIKKKRASDERPYNEKGETAMDNKSEILKALGLTTDKTPATA